VTTAVDSSLLIDLLVDDPRFADHSQDLLHEALALGVVVACPVVWAEVRGQFANTPAMAQAMARAGVEFDGFDLACADLAGLRWIEYRRAGGSRTRLLGDFLVGAHASVRGGRLLTRDRGFYRRYFPDLEILG